MVEARGMGARGWTPSTPRSVLPIGIGRYRMYYAACDRDGKWPIASAVTA
jgi:hypothetical protein